MSMDWDLLTSGPADARRTALLLPGGLNPARSYAELMAQPELAGIRLVAATLPGHCGAPAPEGYGIDTAARLAGRLAAEQRCDAVVGFSMGASVALEMVASGAFSGPVVLLGISLSPRDEPLFFRTVCRLSGVLGELPSVVLLKLMGSVTKDVRVPPARRTEILADLRSNEPRAMRGILRCYLRHLGEHARPAERLCAAGVPVWVVHAEKGDGGLTAEERRTLEACPRARVVTIPGSSFFLPNEEPQRIAGILLDALAQAS
ncbi:alpha/beta fold hydrolase [Kitasatospora sp. NPDC048239]|uniref:alpha/beta fold hydrolase n=1 Tax=Kitasatospora sp. NPDC048239 TaxID=3364046 RepID=UPI0037173F93